MSKVDIDKILGNIDEKYDVTNHVEGMQLDPAEIGSNNFKQEYTVIIRKKKYYAITALEGDAAYIKMYQINNFNSLDTSISVSGTNAGTARIAIAGGTKIVCAKRDQQEKNNWGNGSSGFFNMLAGWVEDVDDKDTTMNASGNYLYNNLLFSNIDDMKMAKYGYCIAEKCDIEPMDEIYIYSKSRREKENGKYKIYQIFFGYISDVTKSYSAGANYPLLQISAEDHTKLLKYSYVAQTQTLANNIAQVGAHYDTDYLGNIIIDDAGASSDQSTPELKASLFTNMFAGKYPYEIITNCAQSAGIPNRFLTKRIEQIKRVPYMPSFRNGQNVEMYNSDLASRLTFCNEAAEKLLLEFFADEEGNLVLKIPNYTLGVNKQTANNAYIDERLTAEEKELMKNAYDREETVTEQVKTYETVVETISKSITHKVVKGDTLWDLANTYLGSTSKWKDIYNTNKNKIKDPHWIYPGQVLIIKKGESKSKQVEKMKTVTTKKKIEGANLSQITDKYIPIIYNNELISFVLTDSDANVANCFTIKQDAGDLTANADPIVTTRTVQDWPSILRFGLRSLQALSVPMLDATVGPALYGSMMVQKSLSQRYKGTLTMIEEASIRVGDPIRVQLYDEHPYKFDKDQLQYGNAQAIFYVTQISRSMRPDGVSTMSLTLSAGRVMGMESIYDKMQLLYGRYYEEPPKIDTSAYDSLLHGGGTSTDSSGGGKFNGSMSELQNAIINYAKSFLGLPYLYGGTSPSTGFDCSGFVQYVYNHFSKQTGKTLSRSTYSQINDGTKVNSPQPCDLFFPNDGHVGLCIGNDSFIHSPHTGDKIKISSISGYKCSPGYPKFVRILKPSMLGGSSSGSSVTLSDADSQKLADWFNKKASGPCKNLGAYLVGKAKQNNVPIYYAVIIPGIESTWGAACCATNNFAGMSSTKGGWQSFSTPEAAADNMINILVGYRDKASFGHTDLNKVSAVAKHYCNPPDEWVNKFFNLANEAQKATGVKINVTR